MGILARNLFFCKKVLHFNYLFPSINTHFFSLHFITRKFSKIFKKSKISQVLKLSSSQALSSSPKFSSSLKFLKCSSSLNLSSSAQALSDSPQVLKLPKALSRFGIYIIVNFNLKIDAHSSSASSSNPSSSRYNRN